MQVGNREVKFEQVLPLKLGDWEKLEEQGAGLPAVSTGSLSAIIKLVSYVLRKADPTVTEVEVRDLHRADAVVVLNAVLASEGGATNRPSSSSSIASQ